MRALGKPLAIAAIGLAALAAIGTYQWTAVKAPAERVRAIEQTDAEYPAADPFLRRAEAHAARQRCLAQRLERERAAGCIVGAVLLGILSGGPGVAALAGCGAGIVLAETDDCAPAPGAKEPGT